MKLIDSDVLLEKDPDVVDMRADFEMRASSSGYSQQMIERQPVIDAIPVQWLEDQIAKLEDTGISAAIVDAMRLRALLKWWREQMPE